MQQRLAPIEPHTLCSGGRCVIDGITDKWQIQLRTGHEVAPIVTPLAAQIAGRGDREGDLPGAWRYR